MQTVIESDVSFLSNFAAIVQFGADHKVLSANQFFTKLCSISANEIVGRHFSELFDSGAVLEAAKESKVLEVKTPHSVPIYLLCIINQSEDGEFNLFGLDVTLLG